ncbi:MAG: carbamoyltransferase HypF [Bacteroidales bacterium]
MTARRVTVRGIVQGVGFRPFIFRLANQYGLKGWVHNSNEAVHIHVEGADEHIMQFIESIRLQAPPAAKIIALEIEKTASVFPATFEILDSADTSEAVTRVSPDIAVCEECLHDMQVQPRRIRYPLINCCHCGPRFSIIEKLPYDRPHTTMRVFEMCEYCRHEYNDPSDRRFHAQPIACNVCGPHYTLYHWIDGKIFQIDTIDDIIAYMSAGFEQGKIFALKGIGGYNLVCNANDETAVQALRLLKHREGKPFAVMFRDIATLKHYAQVNEQEEQVLTSFRRPIVILPATNSLAPSVSVGFPTIGAMLPYMPFHYLLFNQLRCDALVVTSGNRHDEPIIIDDDKALSEWSGQVEGVVTYNRNIHNRVDDSVLSTTGSGDFIFIRRARGYVPEPIRVEGSNFEGIFAAGAELIGTFAIGKGNEVILSQYLGDLQNYDNYQFYCEAFEHFCSLFRFKPRLAAADLHPDYHSTIFAEQLGIPVIHVQHHHAHVAAVMAEHGINEPVVGIAWDGTGLGTDGNIWGGEFLICSPVDFDRYAHFEYIPLPGGDRVVNEPWRTALSYAYNYWKHDIFDKNLVFLDHLEENKVQSILSALDKKINCPLSSSAGRLFDAVAVLLGLGVKPSFHAELPMRLESVVSSQPEFSLPYSFEIKQNIVSFAPMFEQMLAEMDKKDKSYIAKRFHDTLLEVAITVCKKIRMEKGLEKIILSGGTFQNKYLLNKLSEQLIKNGFVVYKPVLLSPNDGSIATGQMYVASCQTLR